MPTVSLPMSTVTNALVCAVVPSMSFDLDRCIPSAVPDSSQQPNHAKHEDGDAGVFGFEAASASGAGTPVRVVTNRPNCRHNGRPR